MKASAPTPPPAPTPVDPGQSATSYLTAMSDPALQARMYAAESTYRPQYTNLNLQDMQQYLQGSDGQAGALDLFADSTARSSQIQAQANTYQRQADIADVMALGPAAAEAFRRANPELTQQLQRAGALQNQADPFQSLKGAIDQQQAVGRGQLGEQLYQRAVNTPEMGAVGQQLQGRAAQLAQSTGQLTPDEIRQSQQAVREAYGSQGRGLDSAAVSGEALSRLTNQRQRMQEDLAMASGLNSAGIGERMANNQFSQGIYGQDLARQQQGIANQGMLGQLQAGQMGADRNYALQLAQAQAALASDPFQAILGRTSGALQYGAGQQGFAGNMTQSMQGPQLFNPDAGINLALQNNANQTGYNNAVYGAQAGVAGANAAATGSMVGGGLAAAGGIGLAIF